MGDPGDFSGFPQVGLDFLVELGQNNKAWFDEHRKIYDSEVVKPAKAFVTAVGSLLQEGASLTQ